MPVPGGVAQCARLCSHLMTKHSRPRSAQQRPSKPHRLQHPINEQPRKSGTSAPLPVSCLRGVFPPIPHLGLGFPTDRNTYLHKYLFQHITPRHHRGQKKNSRTWGIDAGARCLSLTTSLGGPAQDPQPCQSKGWQLPSPLSSPPLFWLKNKQQ